VAKDIRLRTILLSAPTTDRPPWPPRRIRATPVWRWFTAYRGHASLRGADILYIEAMQACTGLIYCISRPCKSARGWYTVYRGLASLLGTDILYIGAMQACAGLIYCISRPCKPARDWYTVYGAMQACAGLLYCISGPHLSARETFVFLLPVYFCHR